MHTVTPSTPNAIFSFTFSKVNSNIDFLCVYMRLPFFLLSISRGEHTGLECMRIEIGVQMRESLSNFFISILIFSTLLPHVANHSFCFPSKHTIYSILSMPKFSLLFLFASVRLPIERLPMDIVFFVVVPIQFDCRTQAEKFMNLNTQLSSA